MNKLKKDNDEKDEDAASATVGEIKSDDTATATVGEIKTEDDGPEPKPAAGWNIWQILCIFILIGLALCIVGNWGIEKAKDAAQDVIQEEIGNIKDDIKIGVTNVIDNKEIIIEKTAEEIKKAAVVTKDILESDVNLKPTLDKTATNIKKSKKDVKKFLKDVGIKTPKKNVKPADTTPEVFGEIPGPNRPISPNELKKMEKKALSKTDKKSRS